MSPIEVKVTGQVPLPNPEITAPTTNPRHELHTGQIRGDKSQLRSEHLLAGSYEPSGEPTPQTQMKVDAPMVIPRSQLPSQEQLIAKLDQQNSPEAIAMRLNLQISDRTTSQSERISSILKEVMSCDKETLGAVTAAHQSLFGQSLISQVKELPNNQGIIRVLQSSLDGDKVLAEATAIRLSAKLNDSEIAKAFGGRTADPINSLDLKFREVYGESIHDFTKRELSASSEKLLLGLLKGDQSIVSIVEIRESLQRLARNPQDSLTEILKRLSDSGIDLTRDYKEIYGATIGTDRGLFLTSQLREALSGMIGVDKISGLVNLINLSAAGKVDLLGVITAIATTLAPQEKVLLLERFKELNGTSLPEFIRDLSKLGSNERELAIRLLTNPGIDQTDILLRECLRRPPSSDRLTAIFANNTPERNGQLLKQLTDRYGVQFDSRVNAHLKGGEQLDLILAQRGAPRTAEEIIQRILINHNYERRDANDMVTKLSGKVAQIGSQYDRNVSKIEEIYYTRQLSGDDVERIDSLRHLVSSDRSLFKKSRQQIAVIISKFIACLTTIISFLTLIALQGSSLTDLAISAGVSLVAGFIAYHLTFGFLHHESSKQRELRRVQNRKTKALLRARGNLFTP